MARLDVPASFLPLNKTDNTDISFWKKPLKQLRGNMIIKINKQEEV